jgi:subfamily B ATP-binding cassette protein MsbA
LGVGIVTVLLWYGSTLVFKESLAPETFFAFVFAFYQVIEPAKSFSSAYYNIRKGLAALDRIDRIMHTENHVAEPAAPVNKTTFDSDIAFRNVSFRYEGSDNNALHQINISIKKGSKIALVGSSGSGKSTMVDLLPRFYDPVEGEIYLDGIDIRNLRLQDLRKMFGVVSQDALLFNDTVEDNIRFGEYAYSEEEIRQAAIAAHAHDFIAEMPLGYKTNIGDRGVKLSGGQRQRLTIARAILRNPSILILDEATSALDSESEKAVQEALSEIMEGRTAFIIAHRLSTIKNADLILVLDKGSIVEQGTHEQLILRNGLYSRLVNLQSV